MSAQGEIYDRWKLDRAVVVDRPTEHGAELGPFALPSTWSIEPGGVR
jgi:hypothetical protein